MRKKVNYLSNKEIMPEILEYIRTGRASERYAWIVFTIAQRLATKPNFTNYTWKDDMISHAVSTCLKYSKNFDSEKYDNPFAYLTTICYNAFQAYLNTQKKHRIIKDKCYNKKDMLKDDPYSAIDYRELNKWDEIVTGQLNYKILYKIEDINTLYRNFLYKYFDWEKYFWDIEIFKRKNPNLKITYISPYDEDKNKWKAAERNLGKINKYKPNMNQRHIILYKVLNN